MTRHGDTLELLNATLNGSEAQDTWNRMIEESDQPVDLTGADLSGANYAGLTFARCKLDGARLEGCGLAGVRFDAASLVGVCFRGSVLRKASFVRARAARADFTGCSVDGTDFSWCDLKEAVLEGVDLAKANLWKTDLRGAFYDEFALPRMQAYVSEKGNATPTTSSSKSLQEVLRVVGAMVGIPYRWVGVGTPPRIELPNRLDQPQTYLKELLGRLNLNAVPKTDESGQVQYFLVAENQR